LSATAEGTLARLVLDAAIDTSNPVATLSLLDHPLSHFSLPRATIEHRASLLEIGVLRVILPDEPDPTALVAAACRMAAGRDAHPAQTRIDRDEWEKIADLLVRLRRALKPLAALIAGAPLRQWIEAHRQTLVDVKCDDDGNMAAAEDFATLERLFDELTAGSPFDEDFSAEDYRSFLDLALRDAVVRGPLRSHSRLKILGLLEARLLAADVMLLGGLDEGVWPPQPSTDAFLNRPMRAELGLTPPERRIGQTAHDFVMAMGNAKVVISRSRKRDGAPTVPSRFLQRIEALAGESAWRACRARGERFLSFARALDRPQAIAPCPRPIPKPPVALRPTTLSVTRIETLRRDPYAIYAERILKLEPLAELRGERGAREAGIFLHELLAEFATALPTGSLPENAFAELLTRAQRKFADFLANADFRAFQWPRIEAGLTAFLNWERERRREIDRIVAEADGRLIIPLSDGTVFALTAKADRIERHVDGAIVIVDYKSGRLPSMKQVKVGFSPQLTLEAAMLERNAFEAVPPPTKVASALYVKVGGGETLEIRSVGDAKEPFGELVAQHFDGLVSLLEDFRKLSTPYLPRPFPQFANSYSDYDHLARVKEWSAGFFEGASES
jgi:ATP-dependent helicase/nuclease subunit B